jgi:hypothetical protein
MNSMGPASETGNFLKTTLVVRWKVQNPWCIVDFTGKSRGSSLAERYAERGLTLYREQHVACLHAGNLRAAAAASRKKAIAISPSEQRSNSQRTVERNLFESATFLRKESSTYMLTSSCARRVQPLCAARERPPPAAASAVQAEHDFSAQAEPYIPTRTESDLNEKEFSLMSI